jgi:hypothetical protein
LLIAALGGKLEVAALLLDRGANREAKRSLVRSLHGIVAA